MNSRAIHETVVRDVVDVLTDMKDYDEVQFLLNRKSTKSFRSAASATKDLILTFPVICSSDISIENASMMAKAIERKAVAMMQILFSAICITNADNAIEYVKKIHTNIDFGSNDVSIVNALDTIEKTAEALESMNLAEIDHEVFDEVARQLRESNFCLPDSVSETSIGSYKQYPDGAIVCNEADSDLANMFNNALRSSKQATGMYKDLADARKDQYDIYKGQILPTDIKKANELMPTLMVITFNQKVKDIDQPVVNNVVIGIKAKLYPVPAAEIANRIKSKVADNNWLNKFIKATTNEISFFKDFIFAIDKAKLDAMSYSSKSSTSKIWRILERRSKKSKIRQSLKMSNDASAITTLLVSQDLVEYIKKNDNIDLENPKTANALMVSYNFMGIAICDESLEIGKFIYDSGDDVYETLSFNSLEREASDGAYKKVINLMTKMQR